MRTHIEDFTGAGGRGRDRLHAGARPDLPRLPARAGPARTSTTRGLAAALVELGHEVHLLSQDRHPERQPFVDAAGDWDEGGLRVRALRRARARTSVCAAPSTARTSATLLPVYVADRYEGIRRARSPSAPMPRSRTTSTRTSPRCARSSRRASPDIALANHLVMGPLILARALGSEVPYAVKVHGSALEYTVKPQPERFLDAGARGRRRRSCGARRLPSHGRQPVAGARRSDARGAHAPRAAGRGRRAVRPTRSSWCACRTVRARLQAAGRHGRRCDDIAPDVR